MVYREKNPNTKMIGLLVSRLVVSACTDAGDGVCVLGPSTLFTDSVAAELAQFTQITCESSTPCRIELPGDRVIPSTTCLKNIIIQGGTAHLTCTSQDGTSPVSELTLDDVEGSISIGGCTDVNLDKVQGQISISGYDSHEDGEGHISVHVTGNVCSGSVIQLGSSSVFGSLETDGSATVQLAEATVDFNGGDWLIQGTGKVNTTGATSFQFGSSTAGITMLDWSWMSDDVVYLHEFLNPAPGHAFKDQNLFVFPGGWAEGSTLDNCTAQGAFGHTPSIKNSIVSVSDDAVLFGRWIEDSVISGTVAGSRLFINNVIGDLVLHETAVAVTAWPLQLDSLCPTCGYVADGCPDNMTSNCADEANHDHIMNGHIFIPMPPESTRRRRTKFCNITTLIGGGTIYMINGSNAAFTQDCHTTIENAMIYGITGGTALCHPDGIISGHSWTITNSTIESGYFTVSAHPNANEPYKFNGVYSEHAGQLGVNIGDNMTIAAYNVTYSGTTDATNIIFACNNTNEAPDPDLEQVTMTSTVNDVCLYNGSPPLADCLESGEKLLSKPSSSDVFEDLYGGYFDPDLTYNGVETLRIDSSFDPDKQMHIGLSAMDFKIDTLTVPTFRVKQVDTDRANAMVIIHITANENARDLFVESGNFWSHLTISLQSFGSLPTLTVHLNDTNGHITGKTCQNHDGAILRLANCTTPTTCIDCTDVDGTCCLTTTTTSATTTPTSSVTTNTTSTSSTTSSTSSTVTTSSTQKAASSNNDDDDDENTVIIISSVIAAIVVIGLLGGFLMKKIRGQTGEGDRNLELQNLLSTEETPVTDSPSI